jgi:DNA polymerase-3 subunit epsilon
MLNRAVMNCRRNTQNQEPYQPPIADIPLGELCILALDCQTTGANPDKGHLLEIGWGAGCADKPPDLTSIRSCLIQQPEDMPVAPNISRITGISEKDLCEAVPVQAAWQDLICASKRVSSQNPSATCPT